MDKKTNKNNLRNVYSGYPPKLNLWYLTEMNKNVRFDENFDRKFNTNYELSGFISHESGSLSSNYSAIVLKYNKETKKEHWYLFTAGGFQRELPYEEVRSRKHPAQIMFYRLIE